MGAVTNLKEFVDTFKISDWQLRKFRYSNYKDSEEYRHGLNGYAIINGLEPDYILISKYLEWKNSNKYFVLRQDTDIYIYEKIELINLICNLTYL